VRLADPHSGVEADPERHDGDKGYQGGNLHGETSALMIAGRPIPVGVCNQNAREALASRA
jgi:hypothetical protein